jgi:hypothetical protein
VRPTSATHQEVEGNIERTTRNFITLAIYWSLLLDEEIQQQHLTVSTQAAVKDMLGYVTDADANEDMEERTRGKAK